MSMKGSGSRLPMRGKDDNKRSQTNYNKKKNKNNRNSNASTPNSSTSSSKSTGKKKLLSVDTKTIPIKSSPSRQQRQQQQQQKRRIQTNTTASSPINFSGGPNSPTKTKEQLEILLNERGMYIYIDIIILTTNKIIILTYISTPKPLVKYTR